MEAPDPPPILPPHPRSTKLHAAILACSPFDSTWAGNAYRVVAPLWANELDLLSGEGARIWGNRWNPPGLIDTVYLSLGYQTAMEEALAQNRRRGVPDPESFPLVTTSTNVYLTRTLDLTRGNIRNRLRVSAVRMTTEPHGEGAESITQAIGRIAWLSGYQGLLVPSAAKIRGVNLVAFPGNLSSGQLTPLRPERLPPRMARGES